MPNSAADQPEQTAVAASRKSFLRELPVLVLIAFVIALLIKSFLIQAFFIPSGSMERTLHGCTGCTGDRVLVNKVLYKVRDIHRGEIVVFNGEGSFGSNNDVQIPPPGNVVEQALRGLASAVGAAPGSDKDYVKRVIGLPGDRIACCTPAGHITVQEAGSAQPVELVEPYVYEDDNKPFCAAGIGASACPPGSPGVLVPPDRLWVMGDHRSQSADSRAHIDNAESGTVPQDKVIGRAFVIVWPFDRVGVLTVPEVFDR